MTKKITVKELRDQLNRLMEYDADFADAVVWYRDADSIDWEMEEGIWDTHTDKDGKKSVALA